MALVKFNNSRNLTPVYTPFNDLFDTFFGEGILGDKAMIKVPAVNIAETDDKYEIDLAVPGLKKEDIKISIEENVLSVSAESKEEIKEENKKVSRREFNYSSFKRTFTLPEAANANSIEAKYIDGVLKIEVAKKEDAKIQAREINIV